MKVRRRGEKFFEESLKTWRRNGDERLSKTIIWEDAVKTSKNHSKWREYNGDSKNVTENFMNSRHEDSKQSHARKINKGDGN